MNKKIIKIFATISVFAVIGILFYNLNILSNNTLDQSVNESLDFKERPEDREKTNKGRSEYFFQLLRNPSTNKLPDNLRKRELHFAENLKELNSKNKSIASPFDWTEIGPNDVAGRTFGIGIDQRNTNIIIAGGASGGIWKSTDGGNTWALKSESTHNLSVRSLIQHPINQDTWYYSTAEFFGTASARSNGGGFYFGSGIYMSTDNGENWNQVPGTEDNDNIYNSQYDFVTKIIVSPTTGTLFYGSSPFGIFRSTQNGANGNLVLGVVNQNTYVDVEVTSDGTLYATLSGAQGGIYISTDDGINWVDITPASFPDDPGRSVIGVSPSDPDIFYVFTDTDGTSGNLSLIRLDVTNFPTVASSDRSTGIPDFGPEVGSLDPQGGYNMVCKVLPNDPDFVIIGATNLFRSSNGFSTVPATNGEGFTDASLSDSYWIGGYAKDNDISQYANHHPDQHNLIFDPNNGLKAYSTHDGGISVTNDITANTVSWTTKEQGYNVTQFYTVSIHPFPGDTRIAGGTQDNGTPAFSYNLAGNHAASDDVSSGDGSFVYLANNYAITSSQNGFLLRFDFVQNNYSNFSYITPLGASDQLFIHPFAVNPSDQNYVAYPEGNLLWRNDQMNTLPRNTANSDGIATGWSKLTNVTVGNAGHIITSLEYSRQNPSGRLYYAGSVPSTSPDLAPKIFRLDNVAATDGEIDISIPGSAAGSFVHDIAVNPLNGDEVIVVLSNYDVESLWYSSDAGANWASIGGNLDGVNGPSVRAAVFAPTDNSGTHYFVGTSIGLFSTDNLDGTNTIWTNEAAGTIDQSVISELDYRISDDVLAVATHGRGLFLGGVGLGVNNEPIRTVGIPSSFTLDQNYPNPFNPSTNINFSIPSNSVVSLKVYDINGREVASVLDNKSLSPGSYTQFFDASILASGTYLYRLEAIPSSGGQGFVETKRMTLIK